MRLALTAAALLLFAPAAEARPRGVVSVPRQTRFLGKDPHGPLAVAKGSKLASPASSACRTWAARGSRWHALDAYGQIVGEAEVTGMDRYDVTNCDELVMASAVGEEGVGVYASGGYRPLALRPWTIAGAARQELRELVRRRDRSLPRSRLKEPELGLGRRLLAWTTPEGQRFAAVGGRALTLLRRDRGAWVVLEQRTPGADEVTHADKFMPLSALDMNADGAAEIVVHERSIDSYADFTLTPRAGGYDLVEAGIHGAFA